MGVTRVFFSCACVGKEDVEKTNVDGVVGRETKINRGAEATKSPFGVEIRGQENSSGSAELNASILTSPLIYGVKMTGGSTLEIREYMVSIIQPQKSFRTFEELKLGQRCSICLIISCIHRVCYFC